MLYAALSFVLVSVLPGCLISFSPLFARFGGWTRLVFGAALSAAIAGIEYEGLRGLGLGSDAAVRWLVWLNLPALWLVWRVRESFEWPGAPRAAAVGVALAVPLVFLGIAFLLFEEKIFWGHSWLHTDMVYALADNPVAPEERALAGFAATYPWFGHIGILIQSSALGLSPLIAFAWINLALAAIYWAFAMLCARALGGGWAAMLPAPFLFAFAVNPIGVLGGRLMVEFGQPLARWAYLMGDPRYDFLLIKYLRLNLNQIGITLLAGLVFLAIHPLREGREGRMQMAAIALMVGVTTLLYPLYLPAALSVAGARVAASLWPERRPGAALLLGGFVAVAAIGAALFVVLPLAPRTVEVGMGMSSPGNIWRHAVMALVGLSLPIVAAAMLGRRLFSDRPVAVTVLVLAGIGCAILAIGLHIPNKDNEYKYVLAGGVVLMPFLCVAVGRLVEWPGHRLASRTILTAMALLCLAGATNSVSRRGFDPALGLPRLTFRGMYQDLHPGDPLGVALTAIREKTPADAILLAVDTQPELPVLTLRSQYVPFDPGRVHPGMTFRNDYLLSNVKGYDPAVITARRADLMTVLGGTSDAQRKAALDRIAALGRPLVILARQDEHRALLDWLARKKMGREVVRAGHNVVWLIPAAP